MFRKKEISRLHELLKQKAAGSNSRILLPESTESRVLEAAMMAIDENICNICLIGKQQDYVGVIPKKYISKITFIDKADKKLQLKYASKLYELRASKGMTLDEAMQKITNSMYFAILALKCGDVDGVAAGAVTHTADVLRPAFQIIKAKEGTQIVSSIMAMDTKNVNFGENGILLMGDCGVVENPTESELACIALTSAQSAKDVFGFADPKVALLSYSTKSTSEKVSEQIQKVKNAFLQVRHKNSALKIDGELQVDSALVPEVAKLKCPHSTISGKANVLVFPDLNSGNISYKLAARVSGAETVGPILQGLNMPVNDISRGATATEILLTICVTAIQADANKSK